MFLEPARCYFWREIGPRTQLLPGTGVFSLLPGGAGGTGDTFNDGTGLGVSD